MKQIGHFIGVTILVAILTAAIGLGLQYAMQNGYLMPPLASRQGIWVDWVFGYHFWAMAFLFSLILGFMLYSIVAFRQKKGEDKDGEHFEGHTGLEITWTVLPLMAVVFFAYLGGESLTNILAENPSAMRVNVTGRQWEWSFDYPEYGITSDVLVLPVNHQALLRLRATDVIHSFWVPEFRVKQDLLPGGEVRDLRVTPTLIGDYKVRCAELCGVQHALMEAGVQVVSRAEFDAWVQQKIAEDPCKIDDVVGCGQKLAQENGCLACHSIDGTKIIGPSWKGIYGSTETFTDGTTSLVDDAYIIESIRNPGLKIVEGFTNAMPANAGEKLSDEQLQFIIEFIKTLK
ncbi:MAG: cytochrome c oxidase subunit II [Anaerolineales bacterium]|nr:cytochrome c oxidase subunit II [Anaerolineales bacterium]